jgi:hypothetical protein
VDPVPDPLLLRKFGSAGNLTQVLRNSDHYTTEAVNIVIKSKLKAFSTDKEQLIKEGIQYTKRNSLLL